MRFTLEHIISPGNVLFFPISISFNEQLTQMETGARWGRDHASFVALQKTRRQKTSLRVEPYSYYGSGWFLL